MQDSQDGQSFVVGRVDRIRAPVPALAAPQAERIRPQMSRQAAEALGNDARAAAAGRVNVRTWPDRALVALGIDPDQAPTAPAAEEE